MANKNENRNVERKIYNIFAVITSCGPHTFASLFLFLLPARIFTDTPRYSRDIDHCSILDSRTHASTECECSTRRQRRTQCVTVCECGSRRQYIATDPLKANNELLLHILFHFNFRHFQYQFRDRSAMLLLRLDTHNHQSTEQHSYKALTNTHSLELTHIFAEPLLFSFAHAGLNRDASINFFFLLFILRI